MQLPDFIKRSLSFFEKAEEQFKASEASKTKISELEKAAEKSATDLAAAQASVKDLQAKVDKAEADVKAKEAEIAKLKGEAVKEKGRTNATIAGQGVPVEQLPKSEAHAENPDKETAWNKYQRLLAENPRAAGAFWAKEADNIMASKSDKQPEK